MWHAGQAMHARSTCLGPTPCACCACTAHLALPHGRPALPLARPQAVVLGILLYVRQQVCSTPIFLGPSGRAMLDTWRGMLDWLQLALPLPLPLLAAPGTAGGGGDATTLCRSVLGGFQLLFGYVLPVLLVALAESRSFVQFEKALAQRDAAAAAARPGGGSGGGARRPAGVRQDAGWLGRLYRALAAAGRGADGMFIWPATMTLLAAACWEAATTVLA